MAEELGTKDVLEQVDARLGNVERDVRDLGTEMRSGFERAHSEIAGLRAEMNNRFESQTRWQVSQNRWLVGLIMGSWLTVIASIWLKG